ncbi:MAG TPA: DUF2076 domain-containing protein [Chthoniobacterales bacterium]
MTPDEQQLISSLFERLSKADTAPKDPEAEQLIQQKVSQFPSAPYLLAQSVVVQEHALANAQARIADLEKQVAAASQKGASHGGFLSGLFGGHKDQDAPPPVPSQAQQVQPQRQAYAPAPAQGQSAPQGQYAPPPPMPYPSTVNMQPNTGSSFLKGALTTAAGVAGGSLLFQGIENLIGHNAGPFSGGLGGGQAGFFPQGGGQPTEVVNNYYMDDNAGDRGQTVQDATPGDQGYADQNANYDPNQDDGGYDNVSDASDVVDDSSGGDVSSDDSTFV